jgi:hypothetical protein
LPWHRFRIGEKVELSAGTTTSGGREELWEILRLLPAEDEEFRYVIRSIADSRERIASENTLRKIGSPTKSQPG